MAISDMDKRADGDHSENDDAGSMALVGLIDAVIERGRADYAAGRVIEGTEAALAVIQQRRVTSA